MHVKYLITKKKYELCKIPVIEYALFAVLSQPQKFDYLKNMFKNIPTLNNFVNQKLQKKSNICILRLAKLTKLVKQY